MRASELLGARVVTADGEDLGIVTGLLCTSDGPKYGGRLPAPVLRQLQVARHGFGAALGYQGGEQRGPWLVRVIMQRVHRRDLVVDWGDVDRLQDGELRLRAGAVGG
jgi:hypothetical protein